MTVRQSKTTLVKGSDAAKERSWFLLDAEGKTLGRFASEVAKILMGKHKVDYTPHADTGDGVIIINAEKIVVTGSKEATKTYRSYTGHPGGRKDTPFRTMKAKKPDYILRHAVEGMLPAGKRTHAQRTRLRIFVGNEHNMEAQQPQLVK